MGIRVDNNHLQLAVALAGLAGMGLFALSRVLSWRCSPGAPTTYFFRFCLLMGLLSWIVLAWLRHDIVAGVGLFAALALLVRHFLAVRGAPHVSGSGAPEPSLKATRAADD
jgi:MFS-type transporter involved in bile tolerance (Atg22 family)